MKKKLLPILAIVLGLGIFLFARFGCSKNNRGGEVVRVERVTKETVEEEGDWETVDFEETESFDSSEFLLADMTGERDHFFQRYRHYKSEDAKARERIAELEEQLISSNSESEAVEILKKKVENLLKKRERDSSLIESLFADLDRPISPKLFEGSKEGKNYLTSVKVTAFGHISEDGIEIKTDVKSTTTTIEKPFEVWKKNAVEIYVGTELADWEYLLGAGYERRGRVLGLFVQGEILPDTKKIQGRAGGRVHF